MNEGKEPAAFCLTSDKKYRKVEWYLVELAEG